jgi:hypothetical protein
MTEREFNFNYRHPERSEGSTTTNATPACKEKRPRLAAGGVEVTKL